MRYLLNDAGTYDMYNQQSEEKDRRPLKYNLYPIRFFETAPTYVHEVPIDKRIEEIDIYHAQYGVAVSDEHECFFITSWLKGIFCCDLKTGQILWNYRLKHATKVFVYSDYILCAFQEIGFRKISYEGVDIAKYPMAGYNTFEELEKPYILAGPSRGKHYVIDTTTMNAVRSFRQRDYWDVDDDAWIIRSVKGTLDEVHVEVWLNNQRLQRTIMLKP